MLAQKYQKSISEFLVLTSIVVILLLTVFNIQEIFSLKVKVLGASTEVVISTNFWQDFVIKHPDYIPAWIELGRMDKVKEIDPNYF